MGRARVWKEKDFLGEEEGTEDGRGSVVADAEHNRLERQCKKARMVLPH